MNPQTNKYALAALKTKRATLAGEIVQIERQLRHRRESLIHVDACLRLLDPNCPVEAIPNKRPPKHINLFRHGELGRLILGALRKADGKSLSTKDIVTSVIVSGGYGADARPTLRIRVRSNLAYLERRGKVVKTGKGFSARWQLV